MSCICHIAAPRERKSCPEHGHLHGRVRSRSGALVGWDEPAPLHDVLVQLGRIPRFAGATLRWWTVLQHVWHVHEVARELNMPRSTRALALLHDAAEVVIGDVPGPMKWPGYKPLEKQWVELLLARNGLPVPDADDWARVGEIDRYALRVEGAELTVATEWRPATELEAERLRRVEAVHHGPEGSTLLHSCVAHALGVLGAPHPPAPSPSHGEGEDSIACPQCGSRMRQDTTSQEVCVDCFATGGA